MVINLIINTIPLGSHYIAAVGRIFSNIVRIFFEFPKRKVDLSVQEPGLVFGRNPYVDIHT